MKFLLLAILLVAFVAFEVEGRKGIAARFNSWKARFGKKNEDKATEEKRYLFSRIRSLLSAMS